MILRRRTTTAASPSLDPTLLALRGAAVDAQRSRLPQMAAALSYRTVFGLLPILAVALWILHGQLSEEELKYYVGKGLELLGLTGITIDPAAARELNVDFELVGPLPPVGDPSVISTVPPPGSLAESQSLQGWISGFVAQINKVSFGAIGLAGIVMLIYAALSMVVEVERAFNQIFRVPHGRSWTRRIVNYWALLTLGAMGLLATFFLQQKFSDLVQSWTNGGLRFGSGAFVITLLGFVTQMGISAGVLLLIYMVIPNTRVRFMPAMWGALLAATIFEASKFAFGKYIQFSAGASYTRLYGSLALVPLFLLWVYFTWLIVLFGMQLTYYIQHGRFNTRAQPTPDNGPAIADPASVLIVMAAAARSFSKGEPVDAPGLATATRLNEGVVRLALGALCERRFLHRIDSGESAAHESAESTYALARSADTIRVAELLELGYEVVGAGSAGDPNSVVAQLKQAQLQAVAHQTLAEAIRPVGSLPEDQPTLLAGQAENGLGRVASGTLPSRSVPANPVRSEPHASKPTDRPV